MNRSDFEKFKARILRDIDKIDVAFEVGYCYKHLGEDYINLFCYWHNCYYFLKGLAHYQNINCWR